MSKAQDVLFRTLADPTRRAIFERLCREGETTVGALTAGAGVSQPVVSSILGSSSRPDWSATATKVVTRTIAHNSAPWLR